MGLEIERKFLLKNSNWKSDVETTRRIKQGYLNLDEERTVRIRVVNDKGLLTIKGKTINTTRLEFEYEIPLEDANQLLELCEKSIIIKTRYIIRDNDKIWEIDIFEGDNDGLEVAEIELTSQDEEIKIPNWIGREVSNDVRYYNANLIHNPYKNWKEK